MKKKKDKQDQKVKYTYLDLLKVDDEDYDKLKNKSDSYIRGWNKVKYNAVAGG